MPIIPEIIKKIFNFLLKISTKNSPVTLYKK